MINWKNLDTLNSYGNLSEVDKVKLSEVMSADREVIQHTDGGGAYI